MTLARGTIALFTGVLNDLMESRIALLSTSHVLADPSISVHEKATFYDKLFESCLDIHAPIKKIKIHMNYRKGLSQETLNLIKEGNQARLECIRATDTNRHVLAIKYRELRNRIIAKIRKESKEAVVEDIKRNNAASECWKTV